MEFVKMVISPRTGWWLRSERSLTESEKTELRAAAPMVGRSFPNGSSYKEQEFSSGLLFNKGRFVGTVLPDHAGIFVLWADGKTISRISCEKVGMGPGADFGPYFCRRDQVYADLI